MAAAIALLTLAFVSLTLMAIVYTKLKNGLKFPKSQKRKLPLRPIPRKGPFRAQDNLTKTYRMRGPPEQMRRDAEERAYVQRSRQWPAEMAVIGILNKLGTYHIHQHICYYPGGYAIFDHWIPACKLRIEADGQSHNSQQEFDQTRDDWLLKNMGIRTLRLSNATCLRNQVAAESIIKAYLKD